MKKTGIIAFTEHGCVLGEKLLRDLQKQDQEVYGFVKSKYVELPEKHPFRKVKGTLREWAEEWIPRLDGIIFFSATGIAVRTIAPFVVSKKTDPAVVVIDEQGSYAISLLSGHLGGANELTEFAAESIGAQPVITTGTDVNHTFAVDVFARKNNLVPDRRGAHVSGLRPHPAGAGPAGQSGPAARPGGAEKISLGFWKKICTGG